MTPYVTGMRIVQLIVIVLLLIGFAARPSVATAVTDGHFLGPALAASLLHQPQSTIVVLTTLEHGVSPGEAQCSLVKCVALGILPSVNVQIPPLPTGQASDSPEPIASFRLGYTQLRPPQARA